MRGKQVRVWVRLPTLGDIANILNIGLFLGNDNNMAVNYAQYFATGFGQEILGAEDGWWGFVVNFGDMVATGSPDRSAITALWLRVTDANGQPVSVQFGKIELLPEPPNGAVTFWFDDGRLTQHTTARPILNKYGFPATYSVIRDIVVGEAANPSGAFTPAAMSMAQLRDLQDLDGGDICCHANTIAAHNQTNGLVDCTPTQLEDEFTQQQQWLRANGFRGGEHFAYPKGRHNQAVYDAVRRHFRSARSTYRFSPCETWPPTAALKLKTKYIFASSTFAEVQAEITRARLNNEWLILTIHDVVTTPTIDSTEMSTAIFQQIVDEVALQGIPVRTASDVMENGIGPDPATATRLSGLATTSALAAHTGASSGAHAASAVSFTPGGTVAATTVQAAVAEVASEADARLLAVESSSAVEVAARLAEHQATLEARLGQWPVLTIDTAGGAPVVSKDVYVNADFVLAEPRNGTLVEGTLRIKGRGQSTWAMPKKPYRLNFDTALAPLGMTAVQKNWALIQNYIDTTKIRGALAFTLGQRMEGLAWTPEFRTIEVILNGDFIGLYQLTDLVRMEAGRLDLTAATGTTGLELTGAYLLEIDVHWQFEAGAPGWFTGHAVPIAYDTPEAPSIEQKAYIQGAVQDFEDALFSVDWLDAEDGYARYIDLASFADWYLVNEVMRNQDSLFFSSCKLYKTRDTDVLGKLHMGPLWDFDYSFGFAWSPPIQAFTVNPPEGWHTRTSVWFTRLTGDPMFLALLRERWEALTGILDEIGPGDWISATLGALDDAWPRDQDRWVSTFTGANARLKSTLSAEALSATSWLERRIAWIDAQFALSAVGSTVAPTV